MVTCQLLLRDVKYPVPLGCASFCVISEVQYLDICIRWRMSSNCVVYGCASNYTKKGKLTYHRFPKNDEVRRIWSHFCKRKDVVNGDNALICSLHFTYAHLERNLKYYMTTTPSKYFSTRFIIFPFILENLLNFHGSFEVAPYLFFIGKKKNCHHYRTQSHNSDVILSYISSCVCMLPGPQPAREWVWDDQCYTHPRPCLVLALGRWVACCCRRMSYPLQCGQGQQSEVENEGLVLSGVTSTSSCGFWVD